MKFSETYFKHLETVTSQDGNSKVKADKKSETWRAIDQCIENELKHFFDEFEYNDYIGMARTNKPGQNNSYYNSHWGFIYKGKKGDKVNAGINMTINKDSVVFCVDIARDKYSINQEQSAKIEQ